MSPLNRKCTVIYQDVVKWSSAKCIDINGEFVQLAPFDKTLNKYDETKATWFDPDDPNIKILWR